MKREARIERKHKRPASTTFSKIQILEKLHREVERVVRWLNFGVEVINSVLSSRSSLSVSVIAYCVTILQRNPKKSK